MAKISSKNMVDVKVILTSGAELTGKAYVVSDDFTLDIEENYDGDYVSVDSVEITGIDESSFEPDNQENYDGDIVDYKILCDEKDIEWEVDDFAYMNYLDDLKNNSYYED